MAKIEIYSTRVCPFCINAKLLFKQKGVEIKEVYVDSNPDEFNEMIKRAKGLRTVPQIFINDSHIGGFEDIVKLNYSGKLDLLLQP